MYDLEALNAIPYDNLNQEQFFQSIFQEVCTRKLLTMERIEEIQLELFQLLGKEVERYTNAESSSVPVEKAQEILQSITYCLGICLKEQLKSDHIEDVLMKEKMSVLFYKGMDVASVIKSKAEQLLKELQINQLKIHNIAYKDTLTNALPEFFKYYEIEFRAFDIPCSIDYPLALPVTNRVGVEFIFEYIKRLSLEHRFLRKFSEDKMNLLFHGFHKDTEDLLVNHFELVLTNVLGCVLAELNLYELNIPAVERQRIHDQFILYKKEELLKRLESAFDVVVDQLILDIETIAYAKTLLNDLAVRIHHNLQTDTLAHIFICFDETSIESEFIIDGIIMEDEKLRDLIEELKEISSIADKMKLIRERVQSMEDMAQLLEECFYLNEYDEVFRLLFESEREMLKKKILQGAGPEGSEDDIPDKQWEKILLQNF